MKNYIQYATLKGLIKSVEITFSQDLLLIAEISQISPVVDPTLFNFYIIDDINEYYHPTALYLNNVRVTGVELLGVSSSDISSYLNDLSFNDISLLNEQSYISPLSPLVLKVLKRPSLNTSFATPFHPLYGIVKPFPDPYIQYSYDDNFLELRIVNDPVTNQQTVSYHNSNGQTLRFGTLGGLPSFSSSSSLIIPNTNVFNYYFLDDLTIRFNPTTTLINTYAYTLSLMISRSTNSYNFSCLNSSINNYIMSFGNETFTFQVAPNIYTTVTLYWKKNL